MEQPKKLWTRDFVMAMVCRCMSSAVFAMLTATMALYVLEAYDTNPGTAGIAVGAFVIGALVVRIPCGKYTELIGRRQLLRGGSVAFLAASFLYFIPVGLPLLIVFRFVHGLTFGIVHNTLSTSVTALIPHDRWGEGLGYYNIGGSVATALGPLVGLSLLQQVSATAMFASVSGLSLVGLAMSLFMKVQNIQLTPEQREIAARGFKVSDFFDVNVASLALFVLMANACYASATSFIGAYSAELGIGWLASTFFVIVAFVMLVSRPPVGRLYDRSGERTVLVPIVMVFLIAFVVLSYAQVAPEIAICLAALLFGLGYGNLNSTCHTSILKKAPEYRLSVATSTYFLAADTGLGVGPVLFGNVSHVVGYSGMYAAAAAVVLCLLVFYLKVIGRDA